jgi:hypothetical protein
MLNVICFERMWVYWDVMLYYWVIGSIYFEGAWCFHFQRSSGPRRITILLEFSTPQLREPETYAVKSCIEPPKKVLGINSLIYDFSSTLLFTGGFCGPYCTSFVGKGL